jgi:hypothetical protein
VANPNRRRKKRERETHPRHSPGRRSDVVAVLGERGGHNQVLGTRSLASHQEGLPRGLVPEGRHVSAVSTIGIKRVDVSVGASNGRSLQHPHLVRRTRYVGRRYVEVYQPLVRVRVVQELQADLHPLCHPPIQHCWCRWFAWLLMVLTGTPCDLYPKLPCSVSPLFCSSSTPFLRAAFVPQASPHNHLKIAPVLSLPPPPPLSISLSLPAPF